MRYSGTDRDDDSEPWFRLGSVDVTTPTLVVGVWVITLLVWIAEPVSKPVTGLMALVPSDVNGGEVWRLFTWPWAHSGFGLFDLIGAALFWLFGTDLERQTGRRPFAWLIGSSIVIIGLAATVLSALLPGETILADLDLLGLTVLLLYIAEHPTRPFFFNIPAWVIGAVIVALEVVNDLAYRDWIRLLTVLVAAGLIALVARRIELLTDYDRVPNLRRKARKPKEAKGGSAGPAFGGRGPGSAATGKPSRASKKKTAAKRPGSLWGRKQPDAPAEIVQMPAPRRRPVGAVVPDVSADDLALDALLDKISDGGMDALTAAERAELDALRARRRGPTTPPT